MTSDELKTKGYRDLLVWQKGRVLVKKIYQLTGTFPPEEKFGLVSRMRRAAVSIPSNIAEGQARHRTGEFVQFISIAEGSVAELETQLTPAVDLSFCTEAQAKQSSDLLEELRRMLNALRRKLETR